MSKKNSKKNKKISTKKSVQNKIQKKDEEEKTSSEEVNIIPVQEKVIYAAKGSLVDLFGHLSKKNAVNV